MSNNTLEGKVLYIGQVESFPSGFSKRELVIEIDSDSKYPQEIPIDFIKDKASYLDKMSIGQEVKIHVNIRGSEYKGRRFVNIHGWKVEVGEGGSNSPEPNNWDQRSNDEDDDPPF